MQLKIIQFLVRLGTMVCIGIGVYGETGLYTTLAVIVLFIYTEAQRYKIRK